MFVWNFSSISLRSRCGSPRPSTTLKGTDDATLDCRFLKTTWFLIVRSLQKIELLTRRFWNQKILCQQQSVVPDWVDWFCGCPASLRWRAGRGRRLWCGRRDWWGYGEVTNIKIEYSKTHISKINKRVNSLFYEWVDDCKQIRSLP